MAATRALAAALGVVLAGIACAPTTCVGCENPDLDAAPTTISGSPSPDAGSPRPDAGATPRPAASPSASATPPTVHRNTIVIAVRDNFIGFEYRVKGEDRWRPATDGGPAVFVGDLIIFENRDLQGLEHSWVNEADETRGLDEGSLFDSGPLEPGERYRWVARVAPGDYRYRDGVVPYRAAVGPLRVLAGG